MAQHYDIKVDTVHDYNAYVDADDVHPDVSVIHYNELPPICHSRTLWGVYGLFLLDDEEEQLTYGSGQYVYALGSIVCVAPSQIGGVPDDGTTFARKGWALLFSPELFRGTGYEKTLQGLAFFDYHVNEALTITMHEHDDCETLLQMLREELQRDKRKEVIAKLVELVLTYCATFYERQKAPGYNAPSTHIVSRLEYLLNDYYERRVQYALGVPTVHYCADHLCLTANYLGDLIRKETGDSTTHFIGRHITRRAKSMLISGLSVTEVACTLGFDYTSHFSRLFSRLEGLPPSEYVRLIRYHRPDICGNP